MIRTNLSSRPFYNVRAVRAVLGVLAIALIALSAFIAVRVTTLRAEEGRLSARATEAMAQAEQLRAQAAAIRAQVDPQELEAIAAAAREANAIIEQRAFSWSHFLEEIEAALPGDVRVKSVQPFIEDGEVRVAMTVEAKEPEDLANFMNALEDDSTFRNVLPPEKQTAEDGIIDATVEATYDPPPAERSGATATGGGTP